MQAPTTDQIRDSIDSGKTGEKVRMPDPAAAPLGTDAEAGGNTPTAQERRLDVKSTPRHERAPAHPATGSALYFAAIALIAVAIVLIVMAAAP